MDTTTDPYTLAAAERAKLIRRRQAHALRQLAHLLDADTIPALNSGLSVWLNDDSAATAMGTTTPELTARVVGALKVDLSQPGYEANHQDHRVRSYDAGLSDALDITVWVRIPSPVDTTSPEPPDRNPAEDRDELDNDDATADRQAAGEAAAAVDQL